MIASRKPVLPGRTGSDGNDLHAILLPQPADSVLPDGQRRYGSIGPSYLAVYEFGPKSAGPGRLNFGSSGDPTSPHFFDQAALLSACKLKPEHFYWEDVTAAARRVYRPGELPVADR